ncbi:Uncharacterized protein dnm_014650 [Desulfonema magnum]|uniref:Uncharacterized protein n=1 Tax=Desulfonema magnum TaxID=45655 RepID=A0A975GLD5_9BACT|nr:Uncharacterized protein dnm_014650 [Desulfonema magnum]
MSDNLIPEIKKISLEKGNSVLKKFQNQGLTGYSEPGKNYFFRPTGTSEKRSGNLLPGKILTLRSFLCLKKFWIFWTRY